MEINIPHGKKTYIIAIATVMYAIGGVVAGFVDLTTALPLILGALGLAGLRDGLARFLNEAQAPVESP